GAAAGPDAGTKDAAAAIYAASDAAPAGARQSEGRIASRGLRHAGHPRPAWRCGRDDRRRKMAWPRGTGSTDGGNVGRLAHRPDLEVRLSDVRDRSAGAAWRNGAAERQS